MKHFSSILLATLVSAALTQLFCAHLELKYTREALTWELKSEADSRSAVRKLSPGCRVLPASAAPDSRTN